LANTTLNNVGANATQYETRLKKFPGRHEGYYISKANQTVSIPSGERFEFLEDELIAVEQSHKVCPSILHHALLFQLTTGAV